MKIKVFIVDRDKTYTTHMLRSFQRNYADKVEMKIFSDIETLYQEISTNYADLLLVDYTMDADRSRIPEKTAYGFLCDRKDIEEINGVSAICKYQKMEILYKLMLGIFAEKATDIKFKTSDAKVRTTMFISVQGGVGTTSAAAAYALARARENKKIFYMGFDKFGDTDFLFTGDGSMSFSDVIYALKSRKSNLIIKLESAVKKDSSGIEFFGTCKNAYDMFELKDNEILSLLNGISQMKDYDEIVVDLSSELDSRMEILMEEWADSIVYVCDGSKIGNRKFDKFCEVIKIKEQMKEVNLLGRVMLLYNRYSSKTSEQMTEIPVSLLGGIHRFEGLSGRALIQQIADTGILKQI